MPKDYGTLRQRMVDRQLKPRGITSSAVLRTMLEIPRHEFVPDHLKSAAYRDEPLPIGEGQTISQPYIVAYMTEKLVLEGTEKVLEVGTGSGYQSAVLASLVKELYTIELIESLSLKAQSILSRLGFDNIVYKIGDGSGGLPEFAPYDAIMATAAPARIPEALKQQLKPGGRLILPVGEGFQDLVLVTRTQDGYDTRSLLPVRFVPLVSVH